METKRSQRVRRWSFLVLVAAVLLTSPAWSETKLIDLEKLLATGNGQAAGDLAGAAVAVSGRFAVVGATGDDDSGSGRGAAYIYERDNDGSWELRQKLTPSGGPIGGLQRTLGGSVSISGNYLVIGPTRRAGFLDSRPGGARAVYVFERGTDGIWEEVATLTGDDTSELSRFGFSLALAGRNLIVGDYNARRPFGTGSRTVGAVYIFERIAGNWQRVQKIEGDGGFYGWSVAVRSALSLVGNYAVVGAPLDDRAYILERDINGTWGQTERLLPLDGFEGNQFGISAAIHGTTAIVGANRDNSNGENSGAAYVFKRLIATNWFQQAKLTPVDNSANDFFGSSVSLSGGRAIIGTTLRDRLRYDDYMPSMPEVAYVFERSPNDAWVEWDRLQVQGAAPDSDFGSAVAISGGHLMVGALDDHANGEGSGRAFFFQRDASEAWSLTDSESPQDGAPDELFGLMTSIDNGRLLAGGRSERIEGGLFGSSVYLFEESGSGWKNTAALVPPINDSIYERGGYADLSGPWAAVGVPGDDSQANNSGAVYMFREQSGGSWAQAQKLTLQAGATGDFLGALVALNGDYAVFSTRNGSAFVFEKTPGDVCVEWAELRPSDGASVSALAVQGSTIFVGDALSGGEGAVYVFRRDAAGNWLETEKITAVDGVIDDGFGWSLAVDADRLVIGAYNDNDQGEDAGSAYLFERRAGGSWLPQQKLTASDGFDNDRFGWEVAVSGNRILVGTLRGIDSGSGAAYLFQRNEVGTWEETDRLTTERPVGAGLFGSSVALENDLMLVGDGFDYVNGDNSGSASISRIAGEVVFAAGGFEDP